MLTPETLLAAGYREDVVPMTSSASRFFQRRITDNRGTRYFIDVYYYAPSTAHQWPGGFDAGVYLDHANDISSETRFQSVTDLAFIEGSAARIWSALECNYREVHDE